MRPPLRIGTRGSALALAQTRLVSDRLEIVQLGGAEVVPIATSGDGPAAAGGDKSRWVRELERALAAAEIDLAVHSAKDVPGELADGLALLGAPTRAAAEDVLCWGARTPHRPSGSGAGDVGLGELRPGARVGTSSVRRAAQLCAVRADLGIVALRGNVDTRLRRLREDAMPSGNEVHDEQPGQPPAVRAGEGLDAIVLARAGLQRLGREDELGAVLDPTRFVPSPGQGTLALEGRADDPRAQEAVRAIADEQAFACLRAERAVAHALQANCDTPLGAHAVDAGCGCLHLRAWVGLPDGSAWVADELLGGFYDPEGLGRRVAERLLSAGAGELLRAAEGGGESLSRAGVDIEHRPVGP
jgi:hydroxymethylbilane synthase